MCQALSQISHERIFKKNISIATYVRTIASKAYTSPYYHAHMCIVRVHDVLASYMILREYLVQNHCILLYFDVFWYFVRYDEINKS